MILSPETLASLAKDLSAGVEGESDCRVNKVVAVVDFTNVDGERQLIVVDADAFGDCLTDWDLAGMVGCALDQIADGAPRPADGGEAV